MKELIKRLKHLNTHIGVVGVKQSTEDEAASYDDILLMRRITELCDIKLNVKIGGCEAKTDINFCNFINSNGIVAPMVETEFALQKFIESVAEYKDTKGFYINVETKTAQENLSKILSSPSGKLLNGIVVGRSDLVKSFGLDKKSVDAFEINNLVEEILVQGKKYGLQTLMGGNITKHSSKFIKRMFSNNLLDYIETRNVIVKLDSKNIKNLEEVIDSCLEFEIFWLKHKFFLFNQNSEKKLERINQLEERLR